MPSLWHARLLSLSLRCTQTIQQYQCLPGNVSWLLCEWVAALKVVWAKKGTVHVGTTTYCACEQWSVDAARVLARVYVCIEHLHFKNMYRVQSK